MQRTSGLTSHKGRRRPAARASIHARLAFLPAAALAFAAAAASPQSAAAEPPVRCQEVAFDVALAPGEPADQELVASLCARGAVQNKTIQVLLHGATFDHHYWDFPHQPETYSYVEHATRAGYAVLNVDRVGYGRSSRPEDGADVDLPAGAFTAHQVIQELRSGERAVPGFGRLAAERVILVGSSMGSFISKILGSVYGGVDGIILTGFAHHVGPGGMESFDRLIPAQEDPKFADLPYDNYLSSIPSTRELHFYHMPNMDPDVAALDTELRQTWTTGEVDTIFQTIEMPVEFDVPTLVITGDYDPIYCEIPCSESGDLDGEADLYPPEAQVEVEIVPDVGHALNLHKTAPEVFDTMLSWADRHVGASPERPPRAPRR